MMLKALIVEELDENGTLRSLKMQPSGGGEIVVSFADEYDEPRSGPFHFHDRGNERLFDEGFAQCKARRLAGRGFTKTGNTYHAETSWYGIPTQRHWVSYYALSLPEFAIPRKVSIVDPHTPGREYRRYVSRDDSRHRFVIYLECSSTLGRFDFELSTEYVIDRELFAVSKYVDSKTTEHGGVGDDWKYYMDSAQQEKVQQFFVHVGDQYRAEQAGAMGHNARSQSSIFQQIRRAISGSDK